LQPRPAPEDADDLRSARLPTILSEIPPGIDAFIYVYDVTGDPTSQFTGLEALAARGPMACGLDGACLYTESDAAAAWPRAYVTSSPARAGRGMASKPGIVIGNKADLFGVAGNRQTIATGRRLAAALGWPHVVLSARSGPFVDISVRAWLLDSIVVRTTAPASFGDMLRCDD
jgi:hypothetical protein